LLAKKLMGADISDDLLSDLRQEKFGIWEKVFNRLLARNCRFVGLSYILHFSLCQGAKAKAHFLFLTLLPPRHVLAQRHGVSKESIAIKHYLRRSVEVFMAGFRVLKKSFK